MNKKGAGRKPLDDSDRKKVNLKIRVREDELGWLQLLQEKSQFDSVSELVRHILFNGIVHVELTNLDLKQLSKGLMSLAYDLPKLSRSRTAKPQDFQEVMQELMEKVNEAIKKLHEVKIRTLSMEELKDSQDWDKLISN